MPDQRFQSVPFRVIEALEPRRHLATHPLSWLPALASRPDAGAKLFVDFNGDPARTWGGHSLPATPAYDTDGDSSTFSDTELSNIQQIWARVAEAYSPFNIDVTTIDPGNRTALQTMTIVVGGNGSWLGTTVGGISQTGGFSNSFSSDGTTGFVFPKNLSNGDPKRTALATAHEAGHGFSLSHQSSYSGTTQTAEYNPGTAAKAPIMGIAYSSTRGLWWYGPDSTDSTEIQDDLAIISDVSINEFGYRGDDVGDSIGATSTLSVTGSTATGSGVIEQTSDRDYFSFTTTGGSVSITGAVAQYGAMLDLKLELRDAAGNLVTSADTSTLGETINTSVSAGTYYVVVASHGSYGDIGQYTLSVTLPSGTTPPVAKAGGPYSVNEGGSVQLSGSASTGTSLTYAWDLDGDGIYGETGAGATRGDETGVSPTFSAAGMSAGSTTVSLRVTDGSNATSTSSATINIVDVTAPTVTSVTSTTANGTYPAGTVIPITVNFSEAVTVTGTPRVTLNTGGIATYVSGNGTSMLTFNYTVGAGQNTSDLDYTSTTALSLNSGAIKDASNNAAVLTLTAPGASGSLGANKNIAIDTSAPTVSNVTSTAADGSYTSGASIPITLIFSEVFSVTGTPTLTLNTGASVSYAGGSGTNTLTFTYIVAAGQNAGTLDYTSITALALSGGTIRDTAGNNATLTLPTPGAAGSLGANKSISIDTAAPTVSGVNSSTANGAYPAGTIVPITVTFSEAVIVTGTPRLSLNTGATADYASGSGTNTLTFSYTVDDGQNASDLNYSSTASLSLNGGTIKDSTGNQASLTLPGISSAGSLGSNKNIVIDTAPPAAVFNGATPTRGATTLEFTVTYSDATGVDGSSLDAGDIVVTGPNGYVADAARGLEFVSVDLAGNGASRTVTYRIAAPGGFWDVADNGQYVVSQNDSEVGDVVSNFRAAGTIGTFNANLPFARMSGSTLILEFDGTTTPIRLATSGGNIAATKDGSTLSFSGVSSILALGTGNDDVLEIEGPVTPSLSFDNENGHDLIDVVSGTYTFASDLQPALANIAVTVDAGANAVFATTQHWGDLIVNGNASLPQGGDIVLTVTSLDVTGQLDLADNDLVVDYSIISPVGSWNGSVYDGVTGLIASGRNGGTWDGHGLITSSPAAAPAAHLTTLAVADVSDLFGISGSQTILFSGQTIDASSVIVKYTYGGDANLDGRVNVDDYGAIDFYRRTGLAGYSNGDFNYDGKIDVDDYGIIDFTAREVGAPL